MHLVFIHISMKREKKKKTKKKTARPVESRPTEKIYFRSVPYNHTECLSVASYRKLPITLEPNETHLIE